MPHGHDWSDEVAIRRALEWPVEGLLSSIERGIVWRPEWGEKPASPDARKEVAQPAILRNPKLIPLIAHRYLPEQPYETGNPVFSAFYSDVIYYGANLADYFEREFAGWNHRPWPDDVKRIPFWSDLAEGNGWTRTVGTI
jgi:hypothetical protein